MPETTITPDAAEEPAQTGVAQEAPAAPEEEAEATSATAGEAEQEEELAAAE